MGTVNGGLFTSTTDEWPTPQALFDRLDAEFRFTIDVAASPENAKCARFYSRDDDGLSMPWRGVVWCNPPYGRELKLWVERAYDASANHGATVVMLIPARTDTSYWHDYVMRAAEVRLIMGRLHFAGRYHDARVAAGASVAHAAPFPSAVVIFRPGVSANPALRACNREGVAARVRAAEQSGEQQP